MRREAGFGARSQDQWDDRAATVGAVLEALPALAAVPFELLTTFAAHQAEDRQLCARIRRSAGATLQPWNDQVCSICVRWKVSQPRHLRRGGQNQAPRQNTALKRVEISLGEVE